MKASHSHTVILDRVMALDQIHLQADIGHHGHQMRDTVRYNRQVTINMAQERGKKGVGQFTGVRQWKLLRTGTAMVHCNP